MTDLVTRAVSQRRGLLWGRGPGKPWNGIVERTPVLWVTWLTQVCKRVSKSPDSVSISWGGAALKLDSVELTFGTRWYWLCPLCGRRCEAIYHAHQIGCRECLHLGYLSQAHRPTSALAQLDRLLSRDYHPGVDLDFSRSSRHYPTISLLPFVKGLRKEFEAELRTIIDSAEIGPVLPDNTKQALALAQLLIDWELESPQVQPIPEGWQHDLKVARQALADLLAILAGDE